MACFLSSACSNGFKKYHTKYLICFGSRTEWIETDCQRIASVLPMSKVCNVTHHYSENKANQGTEIQLDNGYQVWCLACNV